MWYFLLNQSDYSVEAEKAEAAGNSKSGSLQQLPLPPLVLSRESPPPLC